MDDIEYKNIEEALKKLLSNKIDNDAREGKELLQKCNIIGNQMPCIKEHQDKVINYISRIDKEYGVFIRLLANSYGLIVLNKQAPVKCKSLYFYVDVVNKVKQTKDLSENTEYLIRIMSGGNNNE